MWGAVGLEPEEGKKANNSSVAKIPTEKNISISGRGGKGGSSRERTTINAARHIRTRAGSTHFAVLSSGDDPLIPPPGSPTLPKRTPGEPVESGVGDKKRRSEYNTKKK
ncbi:hypothetical protein MLD38_024082 [Melastoma candidum]|uniref:Uncharacterized protein n=1 Tax=Melastoma candidum TaxID=119954 RepID=A0ACB9NTV3_9MYRT|nr:hypothetical protein MLD38_024082 [Melastoma candidum]